MSSCLVPVARVEEILPHPNADRLEIAKILGWQVIVGRGTYQPGDLVVYVPPDSCVPQEQAESWGVAQYLQKGRVRSIKLRGEPSFGFTVNPQGLPFQLEEGMNLADTLGITKYEAPVKFWDPKQGPSPFAPDLESFPKYTDIENLRHFPRLFQEEEPVVITEKIHGTNCRVGMINGELVVGTRRRRLLGPDSPNYYKDNVYWWVSEIPGVKRLLQDLSRAHKQVVLYGEVFGPKIQPFHYGMSCPQFNTFDLLVDGRYVDYYSFSHLVKRYDIWQVPAEGIWEYNLNTVKTLAEVRSTHTTQHIREGVVVRPLMERRDPKVGRVICKYVSDAYLTGKFDDGSQ